MMLTDAASTVDDGLRVSVSELAQIKGVSKQAISKRLARLTGEGLLATRQRGRELTVLLAEWDQVTAEVSDPAKLAGRNTAREMRGEARLEDDVARNLGDGNAKADPTYTEELTRKARYDADYRKLQVDKEMGKLLPVDDVRRAMERCAEAIVREIDQLANAAEDVAGAVSKSGVAGAREVLKARSRALRETLMRSMTLAATDDEETGEPVETP